MTLKQLKDLFYELKKLKSKKEEIFTNDELSRHQMEAEYASIKPREKELEEILNKHNKIFIVEAKKLSHQLREVFKQEIPTYEITIKHHCDGKKYEQEHFYGWHTYYHGTESMILHISNNNKEQDVVLIEKQTTQDNRLNIDFILGCYNVNVYDLLMQNNLPYASIIRKACWNSIVEKFQKQNLATIERNSQEKNLLIKKLEILQDEELRNKEINLLINKIKNLENKNIELEQNPEFAEIVL